MIGFIIGMTVGVFVGVIVMALLQAGKKDDECHYCRAEQARIVRGLEETIHALKSTKGKLAKEIQSLAFLNGGFKAR